MSSNFLKWDLTLAHWTQVSDRCPLGYLFVSSITTVSDYTVWHIHCACASFWNEGSPHLSSKSITICTCAGNHYLKLDFPQHGLENRLRNDDWWRSLAAYLKMDSNYRKRLRDTWWLLLMRLRPNFVQSSQAIDRNPSQSNCRMLKLDYPSMCICNFPVEIPVRTIQKYTWKK